MKSYTVTLPFAGAVCVSVDAENEEHALEVARQKLDEVNLIDYRSLEKQDSEVIECDYYEQMSSGNVRYYNYDRVSIDEQ